MSSMVIGKIDVDVLVQLAVVGPLEATDWRPQITADEADAFGHALWARNYDVAADEHENGEVPQYTFEPLPIAITAGEGLKQIAFYAYQSAGEADDWARTPLRRQLSNLREALLAHVPDYRDAPWGWGPSEVAARSGRPSPPVEAEVDRSSLDEALAHLTAAGLPIDTSWGRPPSGMDPRRYLGGGVFPGNFHGFAPLTMSVYADVDDAHQRFLSAAAGGLVDGIVRRTLRWGGVVVSATLTQPDETLSARLRDGLDALCTDAHLGPPDDEHATDAPPLADGGGEVLATQVLLDPTTAGTHLAEQVVVARTPAQKAAVAAMVADPGLRSRIEEVSTRTHSLVVLRGVAHVTAVDQVVQRDDVRETGEGPVRGTRLSLHTHGATSGYATVLVVDRLPSTPTMTWLEDPGLRRGIRTTTP